MEEECKWTKRRASTPVKDIKRWSCLASRHKGPLPTHREGGGGALLVLGLVTATLHAGTSWTSFNEAGMFVLTTELFKGNQIHLLLRLVCQSDFHTLER
ncbi:hypothetical protein Pcinc_038797 [Petrolisthes cinctipes]|uniref:Uncharacterized protein n=1 Tax=Petrolisthes cinctipes TaxID=88211 RepID=A0AAE1EL81_PETCI|nr:hypothetical protein Pcinc_038797 [Petrolisthes cinctipes]